MLALVLSSVKFIFVVINKIMCTLCGGLFVRYIIITTDRIFRVFLLRVGHIIIGTISRLAVVYLYRLDCW